MAPTLVNSYLVVQSASNLTSCVTTAFTPSDGELLVIKVATADQTTPGIGAASGGGLTYTSRASVSVTQQCATAIITAPVVTSPGSMSVTVTFTGAGGWHSILVERWSGAALAATPAVIQTTQAAGTAPSTTITTTGADSVVSWAIGDWSATAPGTRAYRSSATEEGIHDGSTSNYVAYYAYQAAAVAGSQTVGMTAPTQKPAIVGIEIQSSGATAVTQAKLIPRNRARINRSYSW